MNNHQKTRQDLVDELQILQGEILNLQAIEKEHGRVEEALREGELKYRTLVEASTDAIFVESLEGHILDCNSSACRMFDYTREELIGLPVGGILPEEIKTHLPEIIDQVVASGGAFLEALNIKKDGTVFPVEVSIRLVILDEKKSVIVYVRDISDRKRDEAQLQQRNGELEMLNRAGREFGTSLDVDRVIVMVLEEMCSVLGVIAGSVWLIDRDTGELVCRQLIGPQNHIVRGWRLPPGVGFAGWAAQHGESLVVADSRLDTRHYTSVDEHTGVELRSILSVPLKAKDEVIGVLQVVDVEVDRFRSADLRLTEALAATAAIAIENARLYEQARKDTETKATLVLEVKHLSGLLPICASCKKIRDDKGYWQQVEVYIGEHSDAQFSHGLCPECARRLYPQFIGEDE